MGVDEEVYGCGVKGTGGGEKRGGRGPGRLIIRWGGVEKLDAESDGKMRLMIEGAGEAWALSGGGKPSL